jgi:predicted permease
MLNGIWRDLKQAGRSLANSRAFTLVCVVSLGIGMVPVIAVPYGSRVLTVAPSGLDTDGLVQVVTTNQGQRRATTLWSYPDYAALGDASTGMALVGWAPAASEVTLEPSRGSETTAATLFVSSNYFATMGVPLREGTGFGETTRPVVILSHGFWQRRMGADKGAVGALITVNGVPHTVVGIAPASFSGHLSLQFVDLFVPLERHPRVLADPAVRFDRSVEWVNIHGRLLPGAGIAQARGVVDAITAELAKEYPATNESRSGTVLPYHPIGSLQAPEIAVFTAVLQTLTILPLLVVCLNIGGMMQMRGAMRERELSIRQAIGASRGRLMQLLLAESVLLAAAGAVLASLVLFNIVPVAAWWAGEPLPPPIADPLRVDVSMVAVVAGLCLVTSLVFGWLPAARFSRPAIVTVLKDDAGGGGVRAGRIHRVAVALQIAIATPLLILSGMTLDRVRATAVDPLGFDADLLYAAPLRFDVADAAGASLAVRTARETLAQAGEVQSVTVADGTPLDFRYRIARVSTIAGDGVAPRTAAAHVTRVGDGYLDTMGIPLLAGRTIGADDRVGGEDVALLAQPLAQRLFPGGEAIGQRLTFGDGGPAGRTLTIVGVTGDFPTSQMSTNRAQILVPLAQHPDVRQDAVPIDDDREGTARLMLIARSVLGARPQALTAALERALRVVDPEFDPASIVTGVWLRDNSVRDFLVQSAVAGVAGGVLALLAALGIYGVVGLMVATRVREIAVRVALGASAWRVTRMVVLDILKLVLPGVVVGVLLAVAFVRLNGEDFGIALSDLEPLAYPAGSAAAVLIALAAGLGPARRAAAVPPMVAMRSE